MDVAPGEWSAETWLTVGMVLLGVVVIAYGMTLGDPVLSWYGVAFILLALFVWIGL